MTPPCHNRPAWRETVSVQRGWTADGRRNMVEIHDHMTKGCGVWLGWWTTNPPVRTPDALGFDCEGCRWKP